MNLQFKIEFYQPGKKATIYTIRLKGEEQTEFDKFLSDPSVTSDPEFHALLIRINDIADKYGCQDRFFKLKESKSTDAVAALWRGSIRLYCCRYSNIIIILGSGGTKKTKTYQENPKLQKNVEIMAEVSRKMDKRINDRSILLIENKFVGNLNFIEE